MQFYTFADFCQLLTKNTNRSGVDNLLVWLEANGFPETPASAGHHGNYRGGLLQHSICVFNRLVEEVVNTSSLHSEIPMESVAIVSLLHDVCKVDEYEILPDNTSSRRSICLPMGHGEKSVYFIQKHMQLTDEEALAIRWHMGGWDYAAKGNDPHFSVAQNHPLTMMLHFADMKASRFDEV